tara:strand:- start:277 stop:531 length:255 start_codon:yes stop_codon:yes gene_type:complete
MIENKLLISSIFGLIISGIYYYLYKDDNTNEDGEINIGIFVTIFISVLVITYLIQIGYFPEKQSGGTISDLDISGGTPSYKPPF